MEKMREKSQFRNKSANQQSSIRQGHTDKSQQAYSYVLYLIAEIGGGGVLGWEWIENEWKFVLKFTVSLEKYELLKIASTNTTLRALLPGSPFH